eukprot:TRINITY_DN2292_c0_g1_i1.p1 TRINITY_DN2292_c0_g1~~TRINITY_DN2292_c0_g1_i1.p1  ORF type:complete len:156 (-),score=16.66 TRINITY_DN2292_c0_g1_i1:111-578(-)
MSKGVTVKDVPASAFIRAYAEHLKKNDWIQLPQWVDIVKTSHAKELCPSDPDWIYIRAASIARKIYLRGGVGVGALKKVYGCSKRRGPRPCAFTKASGKIIRYIVQQLVNIGVVEKSPSLSNQAIRQKSGHGKKISQEGQRDLDRIAGRVAASLK